MVCPTDLPAGRQGFNPTSPLIMHIDLNSCFASVEQQANPLLRDKPIAVAAYAKDYGCILAPSVEAKLYGIKTGMTVKEGRELCPYLIVREADPPKYREVHKAIGQILGQYSPKVISKSIDEYCLDFNNTPSRSDLVGVASEIKFRIKSEVGEYLRTSVGLSTNQNLAKLASGIHKPDGLDVIDHTNYLETYSQLKLQDFCGINIRNEARLNRVGIFTPVQFYQASIQTLKSAFESTLGRYWHTRLRGYEIDDLPAGRQVSHQKSFGQSYVLPHAMEYSEWAPILAKLVSKAARRLRSSGYLAYGTYLALSYSDHSHFHKGYESKEGADTDPVLYSRALGIYQQFAPQKKVKKVAVSFFALVEDTGQLGLLVDIPRRKVLTQALDNLNDQWGEYTVTYGSMMGSKGHVHDAIAFGK